MSSITISKSKNSFFFISSDPAFNKVRITAHNKSHLLIEKKTGEWELPLSMIFNLLKYDKIDHADIIYGDDNRKIALQDFVIISKDNNLDYQYKNQRYFLYKSFDNYIRLMSNQAPSLKTYVRDTDVKISTSENQKLTFSFEVQTEIFKIENARLRIRSRKTLKVADIDYQAISYNKLEQNTIRNAITISVSSEDTFLSLLDNVDYLDSSLSILDFYLIVQIENQNFSELEISLKTRSLPNETMWFPYTNEKMIGLTWYLTSKNTSSSQICITLKEHFSLIQSLSQSCESITKEKPVVMVFEIPSQAQENGLFLFKYLMENQNKLDAYYVIDKNSVNLSNLKKYKDHVIFYRSVQHVELFFKTDLFAHTHSPMYGIPYYSSEIITKLNSIKKVFLQHGITALKDVEFVYGKKTNPNLIDYFLVSSERERVLVREKMFYPDKSIKITGFPRFDSLLHGNSYVKKWRLRKNILIMPTWRKGQEKLSDSEFRETTFYHQYMELINNSDFRNLVKSHKLQVNFYLHHMFQKYSHLFHSDFVTIRKEGSVSVQDLLKNNSILITDYSSVGLDFAIQKRSVLYYQFETDISNQLEEAESTGFLPGPIIKTQADLIKQIAHKVKHFKLENKYEQIIKDQLFMYDDTESCKRVYQLLLEISETIDN